jgi:hypothetical protein
LKIDWILKGDLNTKFFHAITNNRYRKNYIFSLKIDNHVTHNQEQIKNFIVNYYKAILGTESSRTVTLNSNLWDSNEKLIVEQNINLEINFTLDEIKTAVFQADGNK